MKALVYMKPYCLKVQDRQIPSLKKGQALIKILASGICGSDVHGYMGITGRRTPPMVMGHEFAGIIQKSAGIIPEGTKVIVEPLVTCKKCSYCINGNTQRCMDRKLYGSFDIDGAFCEYMAIPEELLIPLPVGADIACGVFAEPLAVAWSAVQHLPDVCGKSILVVGAGTIGQLISQCLKYKNAETVIISDTINSRLNTAKRLGADITINPAKQDFMTVIKDRFPLGVDYAIEAVGLNATVNQALSAIKNGGLCIWVGNNEKNVEIDMQDIVTNEKRIIGSYIYNHKIFLEAVDLLNKKPFNIKALISIKISIQEAPNMFSKLANGAGDILKAVIMLN